eukprot:bmy_04177T0
MAGRREEEIKACKIAIVFGFWCVEHTLENNQVFGSKSQMTTAYNSPILESTVHMNGGGHAQSQELLKQDSQFSTKLYREGLLESRNDTLYNASHQIQDANHPSYYIRLKRIEYRAVVENIIIAQIMLLQIFLWTQDTTTVPIFFHIQFPKRKLMNKDVKQLQNGKEKLELQHKDYLEVRSRPVIYRQTGESILNEDEEGCSVANDTVIVQSLSSLPYYNKSKKTCFSTSENRIYQIGKKTGSQEWVHLQPSGLHEKENEGSPMTITAWPSREIGGRGQGIRLPRHPQRKGRSRGVGACGEEGTAQGGKAAATPESQEPQATGERLVLPPREETQKRQGPGAQPATAGGPTPASGQKEDAVQETEKIPKGDVTRRITNTLSSGKTVEDTERQKGSSREQSILDDREDPKWQQQSLFDYFSFSFNTLQPNPRRRSEETVSYLTLVQYIRNRANNTGGTRTKHLPHAVLLHGCGQVVHGEDRKWKKKSDAFKIKMEITALGKIQNIRRRMHHAVNSLKLKEDLHMKTKVISGNPNLKKCQVQTAEKKEIMSMEGSKPAVNVSLASQQHILQFCQGSMNLHFVTGPRRRSLSHLAGLLLPWPATYGLCDWPDQAKAGLSLSQLAADKRMTDSGIRVRNDKDRKWPFPPILENHKPTMRNHTNSSSTEAVITQGPSPTTCAQIIKNQVVVERAQMENRITCIKSISRKEYLDKPLSNTFTLSKQQGQLMFYKHFKITGQLGVMQNKDTFHSGNYPFCLCQSENYFIERQDSRGGLTAAGTQRAEKVHSAEHPLLQSLNEELNPLSKTRWVTGVWGKQYHSPSHPLLRSGPVPKQTGKGGSNTQARAPKESVLRGLPFSFCPAGGRGCFCPPPPASGRLVKFQVRPTEPGFTSKEQEGERGRRGIQGGRRLRSKYFGVAKARSMRLSVLAAQKFRFPPPTPPPPKRLPMATLTLPVAVRAALRSGSPAGL